MRTKYTGLAIFLLAVHATDWAEAAPPLVNYQGFLTDAGGQPLNDVTSVTFRIWTKLDAVTSTVASDLVWAEKHESVSVVDGRINVILGNGTPVTTDLTAATNAVDNLGEAFQEDATYIGITINDANNQFDPGEEITPRQQLLSVPYALNAAGGAIRKGLLVAPEDESELLHRVCEVIPGTAALRLAQDFFGRKDLIRGVYLGNSRMQIQGIVALDGVDLSALEGQPVYLSEDGAGGVLGPEATELSDRSYATLIGFVQHGNRVDLDLRYTRLRDQLIRDEDRFPLINPDFESSGGEFGWVLNGAWSPIGSNCSQHGQQSLNTSGSGYGAYQDIDFSFGRFAYLQSAIDAGVLRVRFGASSWASTTKNEHIQLQFYDLVPPSNSDGDMLQPPSPFSFSTAANSCVEHGSIEVAIPPQTRFLRMHLLELAGGFKYDNIILELRD